MSFGFGHRSPRVIPRTVPAGGSAKLAEMPVLSVTEGLFPRLVGGVGQALSDRASVV